MSRNSFCAISLLVFSALSVACSEGGNDYPPANWQGLRTVVYNAPDLDKAKAWYSEALGVEPYLDEPFYVGFNVGGYELALDPDGQKARPDGAGVTAYWGVDDVQAEHDRLLAMGARTHQPVQDVGGGIQVAAVLDPFGNLVGLIHNPHFRAND